MEAVFKDPTKHLDADVDEPSVEEPEDEPPDDQGAKCKQLMTYNAFECADDNGKHYLPPIPYTGTSLAIPLIQISDDSCVVRDGKSTRLNSSHSLTSRMP